MAFSVNGSLNKNLRTHVGTKPYPCGQCIKAFSKDNHVQLHKGNNP